MATERESAGAEGNQGHLGSAKQDLLQQRKGNSQQSYVYCRKIAPRRSPKHHLNQKQGKWNEFQISNRDIKTSTADNDAALVLIDDRL